MDVSLSVETQTRCQGPDLPGPRANSRHGTCERRPGGDLNILQSRSPHRRRDVLADDRRDAPSVCALHPKELMDRLPQTATLYRMVMKDHVCPYGLKAKDLLEREGYSVVDHWLETRQKTDAFQREHGVDTTPQIWIGNERIGGYEALREHLGVGPSEREQRYRPVLAVFAMALPMALATSWAAFGTVFTVRAIEWFVAISMCILALLKLRDVERFSTMFLNYDLLAKRFVRYATFYPYAEGVAGVLMISGALTWLASPIALFIGTIGAVSVVKAVYIEGRELECACVGGDSSVPLGFLSLTENLMMIAMGIWMALR
jgi:glutaredoxin